MNPTYLRRPATFHFSVSLILATALAAIFWYALTARQWHWQPWLVAWLVGINATAFGYYGYDKHCAGGNRARVPEIVLHGLALLGGSLGAYTGMRLFRHKTIKGRFRFVFWSVVVLQVGVIAWIVKRSYLG